MDPLKILPDLSEVVLQNRMENLAGILEVGDRVSYQLVGTTIYIWGKAGIGDHEITSRRVPTLAAGDAYIARLEALGIPTLGTRIFVTSENQDYVKLNGDIWGKVVAIAGGLAWVNAPLEPAYNNSGGTAGRLQFATDGLTVWVRGGTDGPRVQNEYTIVAHIPDGFPAPAIHHRVGTFGGGGRVAGLEVGPDPERLIKQVIRDPIANTWIAANTSYPAI
ncbi:hypothetical protein V5R04_15640 [Jonesiaceae bacterium BS-20]|uniref:Minor tail protein n=1 Tax=Jonesiaceae bacterium BS-20 TaxID=3120821 RepID=A0AAU7DWM7_9MICO